MALIGGSEVLPVVVRVWDGMESYLIFSGFGREWETYSSYMLLTHDHRRTSGVALTETRACQPKS